MAPRNNVFPLFDAEGNLLVPDRMTKRELIAAICFANMATPDGNREEAARAAIEFADTLLRALGEE